MNRTIILVSLTLFFSLLFIGDLVAQDKKVEFRFEVDGKPVRQKFKVQLDIDGKIIEAKLSKNGFYLPLEFQHCKTCEIFAVRFTSKKYILAFDGVYRKNFDSNWVLGIDNRPFDVDNINISTSYENIRTLHYLGFRPKDDEIATRLTVLYPEKKRSKGKRR